MQHKHFAAGLTALLFAAAMASAQARIMPSFHYNAPISINVTPADYPATAVTGLPYSGDRTSERILSDGTHMSQSMVREFRDSFGRTRAEHSGQGFGSLTVVEIVDPVAGFDWVLDPANQVAYRMVLQSKSRTASSEPYPCDPAGQPVTQTMPNGNVSTIQSLGSQTMEGVEACGRRNSIIHKDGTPGITTEMWRSRVDIPEIMLDKTSDLQGGNHLNQLVNLRLGEPDPGMFEPPAQYRVVDETAAFTITEPASVSLTSQSAPAPASRTIVALTGMPWSGDVMNGNTLSTTEMRDSMGRMRREQRAGATVTIVDPVAGYSYTLDASAHTAHRRAITVQSTPASEATAPAVSSKTETMPSGVIRRTESLGTKTIDGVVTVGRRVTLTYPPGTINGNDKTTTTVTEWWASPQLGVSLVTQNSGALAPSFTDRLINLKYTEPDPSLFRVPDGYQVIDDH